MESEARFRLTTGVAAHPLAELLACPPHVERLLSVSSESVECESGEAVFSQYSACRGLYVVAAGDFVRKAERLNARLTLGSARAGDLVELAAALGDGCHTYTLTALSPGSLLLLPIQALHRAFEIYSPLRMHPLEELAREVSRTYAACCLARVSRRRQQEFHSAV
jgi:CRP-like cAMP-binding protein